MSTRFPISLSPWLQCTLAFGLAYAMTWVLGHLLVRLSFHPAFEATVTSYILCFTLYPCFVFLCHRLIGRFLSERAVSFRQGMHEIHSFSGLLLGWVGIFLFLMGSIALYRSEITFWMQPETHRAALSTSLDDKVKAARTGLALLAEKAPEADMWTVTLPGERTPVPSIRWASKNDVGARPGAHTLPFDCSTQTILTPRPTGGGTFLYRLHVDLFGMDRHTGRFLVGVATLLLLAVTVNGVLARRHFFRDFFLFRKRPAILAWHDTHCIAGGITLPFVLLFCLSGLFLTAQGVLPSLLQERYAQNSREFMRETKGMGAYSPQASAGSPMSVDMLGESLPHIPDPAALLGKAEKLWPGTGAGEIILTWKNGGITSIQAVQARSTDLAGRAAPQRLTLDIHDGYGELTESGKKDMSGVKALWYGATALHLGRFASPAMRTVLFLFGMLSVGMMAAGLLFREKRQEKKLSLSSRVATLLNTVFLAGLPLAVGCYFLVGRLIGSDAPERIHLESSAFFLAWGLSAVHALWRKQTARRVQLLAGGLLFILLPVINGMTGGLALNCTLLHGPWQLAFIDILLIVVGLLFLFIGYHKTTFPWKNNLDCQ